MGPRAASSGRGVAPLLALVLATTSPIAAGVAPDPIGAGGARELKFIHITKTGGTSIENDGKKAGIKWGRNFNPSHAGHWHACFKSKSRAWKTKYDWFMVVRNPCDRVLSEFRWMMKVGMPYKTPWKSITVDLGLLTQVEIDNYIVNVINCRNEAPHHSTCGWNHHWHEQTCYDSRATDPDVVLNILRFENLAEDFSRLMTRYDLDVQLSSKHSMSSSTGNQRGNDTANHKPRTVASLSPELLEAIVDVYGGDMAAFNYTTCLDEPWEKVKERARENKERGVRTPINGIALSGAACPIREMFNTTVRKDPVTWCRGSDLASCHARLGGHFLKDTRGFVWVKTQPS